MRLRGCVSKVFVVAFWVDGGLGGDLREKAEDQERGDDVEWDHERAENLRTRAGPVTISASTVVLCMTECTLFV